MSATEYRDDHLSLLDRFRPFPKTAGVQEAVPQRLGKLTWEQVEEIRAQYGRVPSGVIAEAFNISVKQVRNLNRDRPAARIPDNRRRRWSSRLTDEQVREIRARYKPRTVSTRCLAREYGVSSSHISRIINRKKRKGVTNE